MLATECVWDLDKLNLVKFGYDGLVIGLRKFLLLSKAALKIDARFKRGQKWLSEPPLAVKHNQKDSKFNIYNGNLVCRGNPGWESLL